MVLLILALAPVALMLHFVYVRDKYERDPLGQVLKVYFIGFLSVIPAVLFESLVLVPASLGLVGIAISTFLVIALSEELAKYWALRLAALPNKNFNEVYDGILYGVAVSLGFATVENLGYVFLSGEEGVFVAVMRAVLAVPAHALWGVMMGYYLGRAKFEQDPRRRTGLVWRGLLTAIFWHGLYDFFAFSVDAVEGDIAILLGSGVLVVVIVNWVIALRMIRSAQQQSVFKRPNPLVHPVHAYHPGLKFCHQCGKPAARDNGCCNYCGYWFPAS